ncbi:hypothetical protein SAMN05216357_112131 [Porphyromonadaceae bacterium KH3CP3RA]|nr:hypothetical protein SAMN05216357_112131 [Porphyromonadaceae bacterium KH3CP3RA]
MAIGSCIIDTVDLAAYGIFIERGGSDEFLSFPDRRTPDQNDWAEHDGLDVDLSDLSFEAKKVQVKYVIITDDETAFKQHLSSFETLHFAAGYRSVFVKEFNRTFQLRFTGFSNYSHKGGLYLQAKKTGRIAVEYSMDDPLQFFTPAIDTPITTRATLAQVTLNDIDLSRFGIVVRDIYSTALRPQSAKPVLERKINHITGLTADTGVIPKRQARTIEIQCTMVAGAIAEFMTNWNALFNNLRVTVPVQLGITRTGSVLNCYYSKMTNFKKETPFSRKVKVSFNLILQEI